MELRAAANQVISEAIRSALPDEAVLRALTGKELGKRVHLVSIGKAAWQMAKAASNALGDRALNGIVITKYDHVQGELPHIEMWEAGHPMPDANSYAATRRAMKLVQNLTEEDTVLFLVSGGGSALFESPLIPTEEMENITSQLLSCGADIMEMNTIRKRLSSVKGGKFGAMCRPAKVFSIVLSDIIGDPLDMIASGPAVVDTSTTEQALEIVRKYGLKLSNAALEVLRQPMPTRLDHVETVVTGSVRQLCVSASETCRRIGIEPIVLTASLCCTARDAGSFLASIAQFHRNTDHPVAFIAGGETVVRLTGKGKGGRNQEVALAAAEGIAGLTNAAVFSVGSDGTDGPTDAAGGYVDGDTCSALLAQGIRISDVLMENDAYHALEKTDGLIKSGPTGTNVNDLSVLLLDELRE